MSGPIQVQAEGLLGVLQLKNAGQNPRELIDSVQPTFDLWTRYLECQGQIWTTVSSLAQGPGAFASIALWTTNPIVVPQSEWWYVNHYGIQTTDLTAGDLCQITPAIRLQSAGFVYDELCPNVSPIPLIGAGLGARLFFSAHGFFVPPGSEFGFWQHQVNLAAAETFTARLRYTVLQI